MSETRRRATHRRWGLPALGLLLLAALTQVSPFDPVTALGGDGVTTVQARPADDLVESVGVGVHLGFLDTPYADTDQVVAALRDLGVRHVRDEFRLDQPRQWQALRQLGDAGIRSSLIVGPRPDQAGRPEAAGSPEENVAAVVRELPGAVESVEGANEWDLWGGPGWAQDLRRWQRELYDAASREPSLAGRVLAPSIAMRHHWEEAGSFADVADRANAHLYPDGRQPDGLLHEKIAAFEQLEPDQPLVLTETGYHNATGPANPETIGHPPVPEQVAAAYLPRLVAGTLAAGVERTYLYELLDQFPDPSHSAREDNFGLLRNDLSPKPAYRALRDLLTLAAGGTSGAAVTDGTDALGLGVVSAPDDLRRLVLQRPDGSFLVLLWRDVTLWDVEGRQPLPVDAAPVTVVLDPGADHDPVWQLHRPGSGPAPVASGEGERVPLDLDGHLVALVVSGR